QTTNLSGGCAGSTVCVNPGFAWNHGDVQEEIANTWVGLVGPGVAPGGRRLDHLDRSHERPADDHGAARPEGRLRPGRTGADRGTDDEATPHPLVAHRARVRGGGGVREHTNAP